MWRLRTGLDSVAHNRALRTLAVPEQEALVTVILRWLLSDRASVALFVVVLVSPGARPLGAVQQCPPNASQGLVHTAG